MTQVKQFLAQEDIVRAMRLSGEEYTPCPKSVSKKIRQQCGGYAVCTRLPRKCTKRDDLTSEHRVTKAAAAKIAAGMCISSTKKGNRYFVLPVYASLDTAPDQEQYEVRYIRHKTQDK